MSIFRKEKLDKIREMELGVSKEQLSDFFMMQSMQYGDAASRLEEKMNFPPNVKSHYRIMSEVLAGFYQTSMAPATGADVDGIIDEANKIFDKIDQEFGGNASILLTKNVARKEKEELKQQFPGLKLQLRELSLFLTLFKEYSNPTKLKKTIENNEVL